MQMEKTMNKVRIGKLLGTLRVECVKRETAFRLNFIFWKLQVNYSNSFRVSPFV